MIKKIFFFDVMRLFIVYIIMFLKLLFYRNFYNIVKFIMVMVYSCLREFIVFRRIIMSFFFFIVFMVRVRRLGVKVLKF